ncbi:Cloroperoxidase [Setomelanomma holmii]|uniref:Cloroperoxidase n=1 Tax=Setomelanomma holmii TaxID=210430 RepID=A0A9P4GWF6_9PLEO|nr:Cloroperoxidase [Setomelanomma holmii]
MKFLSTLFVLSSSCLVSAFPTLSARNLESLTSERLEAAINSVAQYRKEKRLLVDSRKPIDVTGRYAFQAPKGSDQRGPCPGLDALANHGYIPHSGITSFAEVVNAINQSIDLALILDFMGTVWTGNPLSLNPGFSIGGPAADNLLGNVLGLIGDPRGLQGSHNWIESDSSLTRDDLYDTGNAWTMNLTLFRDIYDRADEEGVISMDLLADQAARRWAYSIAHNPNFYYGPVTGMVSRNARHFFLGRLLSNHTSEHPDGLLTQDVFKKFFAVYEDAQGNLDYREGHETIPENWYRKPVEYGLVALNLDIVGWVMKHPQLRSVGGNTGTANSFSGLNMQDITSNVLNMASLLENSNRLCFVFGVLKTFQPNSLSPLLKTLEVPINLLTDTLAAPVLSLACPAWKDLTEGGEPLWDAIQQNFPRALKAVSSL